MSDFFKVGCIQFCADDDVDANLLKAKKLTLQAVDSGAELICLPEYFAAIEVDDQTTLKKAVTEEEHPALQQFIQLAKEQAVWLQLGSLPIRATDSQVYNRAFLINSSGEITARYNKIHLFDVTLSDGESYHESKAVKAGNELSVAELPWGKLGMSVCYDVRFPEQFRRMAKLGVDFITTPAAFTQRTGEAHWHVLQRARAIENGCFVFAAGQSGVRSTGRATYGHSLIIDPWGTILADAGESSGFIVADIDPLRVMEARSMIPSLQHGIEYN